MVRQVFNLSRKAHRYFVEPISQCLHAKVKILSRFVTFYKSLINSSKMNVRFLANLNRHDQRTLLGRNLTKLCDLAECDPEQLSASVVKKNVKYKEVPEVDSWRVPMLQELLMSRDGELTIKNLDQSEITELIDDICIS